MKIRVEDLTGDQLLSLFMALEKESTSNYKDFINKIIKAGGECQVFKISVKRELEKRLKGND